MRGFSNTVTRLTSSSHRSRRSLLSVLRNQGKRNSEAYVQQIIRAYPKFVPLLNSRIPQNLLPLICNDPVVKRLASIIGNPQVSLGDTHRFADETIRVVGRAALQRGDSIETTVRQRGLPTIHDHFSSQPRKTVHTRVRRRTCNERR